ncbi:hypothetical protein AXF42_Ash012965 [Apostasia shenzhenica]|uniref:Chaperonin-like RbcX protein 2, chloroplastic n=1 Tax=Apostasia shenzhenica TaxID=1088818 RepID=A0A2I0ARS7_9ASPA|nr:hypothetical protein AXF42_Ash012965 [Apostasia shenzhenica]
MAGAQAMVIGPISSGFGSRSSSCDLGFCGVPSCPRPAASTLPAGLSSSFIGGWGDRRRPAVRSKKKERSGGVIVDELGGHYEEGFDDVHRQLINYFTYKAIRTVLHQLYEMNPPKYIWFYNFVSNGEVKDGTRFLQALGKEHQELAERVMVTRLHLYGKWIKKCDHAKMYQRISDENLKLMRERLMETIIWPSEDTNAENAGSS